MILAVNIVIVQTLSQLIMLKLLMLKMVTFERLVAR